MTEYGKPLEKTPDTSPKIGGGVSVMRSIEDFRKCMRDKYIDGLVSDVQFQELGCLLDARLADYQDNHEKSTKELEIAQEMVRARAALRLAQSQRIHTFTGQVASIEERIKTLSTLRKENTGVVGGVGDTLVQGVNNLSGSEKETGKSIYERQLKQLQNQTRELHTKIRAEFGGQDISPSEKASADALVARLDKIGETELAEVSWWKAVFNSAGIGDIQGNVWSHENVAKKDAKNIIGLVEGVYDLASFLAEIAGKAIGIYLACWWSALSEGTWDSSVRRQAAADIRDIFSSLTVENAKKALDLIPQAVEAFKNASPDEQAEGFGKFFAGFLIGAGVGVGLVKSGKYAKKLGSRAVRMAKHCGWIESLPLAMAGRTQQFAWMAAVPTGNILRVAEADVHGGKKVGVERKAEAGISKLDISPRIVHEIEGTAIFLKDIPDISSKELERALIRIMRDHPGKEIRFDDSISPEAKRALSTIISKNHPLVEVVRLIPGNDVVNITFAGIKKLNDTYGQAFVDRFMDSVRDRINGTFHAYTSHIEKSGAHAHARGIRTDDYKNFTVSLPPDAPLESVLFSGAGSKNGFIEEIIESARQDIESIAREKGKTPKEVEDMIRTHLNFGVGKSSVPENATDMDKLQAFYEAEMNSRKGLESSGIETVLSDPERTAQYAQEAMQQKADILRDWEGKWFTFEWVEYPAVIRTFGTNEPVLHPQLERQVRKWEAIDPKALAEEVWTYISMLNKGFDFIAPSHDLEADFRKAHAFNADFHNGVIKPEAILQTYKGTLTKEAFFGLTEGKTGMRAMIDIKDMGLANLASFRRIAEKVASGKYTREDLLGAGSEVTEQFVAFVEMVRREHPNAKISLGGDEVYLFFEGTTPRGTEAILTSLHKNLGKSSLEGRVSHSFDSQNSRELFAQMDGSMNIHKKVEASIEEVLSKDFASVNPHKTISVHVNEGIPMEANLLGIIKGARVQNMIGIMMQSIREGKTLIHETLKLPDGVNLKCDYDDGMFRFVFNP